MYRIQRQLEAVGDAELVKNIVQMVFDGLLGDKKLFADFLVAEALRDKLDDFFFAVAEQRLFAARAGFAGLREGLHDLGGHAVIEPDFAGVHAMNAFYQEVGGGLLQDHAASAEAHGANDIAIVFRGGQHNNARGQRIEIDFLEDGEAILIRHAEIEEKNIGFELGQKLNALRAVLGFADDGDFIVGIEEFAQAITENGVIVG